MKNLVLCYNLYSPRPNEDRKNRVLDVINKISPDIMGLQEITPAWKSIIDEAFSEEYAFLGNPREEGRDCEFAPVLYKKEKYECIDWNTYWLSDTPNEKSRFEESKYYRICTVAKLRTKADGSELLFVNLHMDYVHAAAKKQMEMLLPLLETYGDVSTVICGDFNCNDMSEPYAVIASSKYKNAKTIAKICADAPTFTKFGERYEFIDFVFTHKVNVESFFVGEVKVNGEYPSDHNPVVCEVEF